MPWYIILESLQRRGAHQPSDKVLHHKLFADGSAFPTQRARPNLQWYFYLIPHGFHTFKFSPGLPFKLQPLFSIIFSTLLFFQVSSFLLKLKINQSLFSPPKNQSSLDDSENLAKSFWDLLFVFLQPLGLYATSSSLNCWNIQFNGFSNSKFSVSFFVCVLLLN